MDITVQNQIERLPLELAKFLAYSEWDDLISSISDEYKLSDTQFNTFHQEIFLVLLGLTYPDDFRDEITNRLEIETETLDALILEVEEKIFASIRPALIQFFESEQAVEVESGEENVVNTESLQPTAYNLQPVHSLPIEKYVEPSIIKLIPKNSEPSLQPTTDNLQPDTVHPFEEKMKTAFTGSIPTSDEPSLESASPLQTSDYKLAPSASPQLSPTPVTGSLRHDPYREAIE